MSHVDSARELASIFNPRNEARPTILLGAGASFSSGVPLATRALTHLIHMHSRDSLAGVA
jgi:hypothetical protein